MSTFLILSEERVANNGKRWLNKYVCVCGKEIILPAYKVNSLHTKSCGCKKNDFINRANSTHNLSKHPLFSVWAGMIARCYSEGATKYPSYGARGVRICDVWKNNFKEFYDWALANGWSKGKQIDKDIIPKKLGIPALLYSPELCCVVTNKENSNSRSTNRLIEYKGEIKTISQWADVYHIEQKTLRARMLKHGFEKAISMPYCKQLK